VGFRLAGETDTGVADWTAYHLEGFDLGPGYGSLSREGVPETVWFVESDSRQLRIAIEGAASLQGLRFGSHAEVLGAGSSARDA
jgi:hypothetical protein